MMERIMISLEARDREVIRGLMREWGMGSQASVVRKLIREAGKGGVEEAGKGDEGVPWVEEVGEEVEGGGGTSVGSGVVIEEERKLDYGAFDDERKFGRRRRGG